MCTTVPRLADRTAGPGPASLTRVSHRLPRAPRAGYIDNALAKAGTAVKVDVRGKINDAVVTKMPFVPTHYFKG